MMSPCRGTLVCAITAALPCQCMVDCAANELPSWVSGRTETKTYGKSATEREREEQSTLLSTGIFGKDT
jgi:hypothetical protein